MTNRSTEDFERQQNQRVSSFKSGLDYLFGAIFIIVGIVCFVKFKHDTLMLAFGGVAVLYGVRRIYTGYKKKSV